MTKSIVAEAKMDFEIASKQIQKKKVKNRDVESAFGEKIRALRVAKKLSLQELAQKAGLTSSNISQIERGLSNPSLGALRRLAEQLEVPVFYFFMGDEMNESEIIVRHNRRKELKNPDSNVYYELLSPNLNKAMELVSVILGPGDASSNEYFTHKGEEACVILSGRVTIMLGEATYVLEKGDSVQFNASIPHKYINQEPRAEAQLLFVITPPSF